MRCGFTLFLAKLLSSMMIVDDGKMDVAELPLSAGELGGRRSVANAKFGAAVSIG